jgi:hypothetical protein
MSLVEPLSRPQWIVVALRSFKCLLNMEWILMRILRVRGNEMALVVAVDRM